MNDPTPCSPGARFWLAEPRPAEFRPDWPRRDRRPPRAEPRATSSCFLLGLNTSTIRGQKLSRASGFQVMLSLELFNRQYWKEVPLTVARTGLRTMKTVVAASEQEPS